MMKQLLRGVKKPKQKQCTISGKLFDANNKNFYSNKNSNDGLHPYHKSFDDYRRKQGLSVESLRSLVKLINS